MTNAILTQARLKELLHYNPETGVFTWIKSNSPRAMAGAIAGTYVKATGYCALAIDNKDYLQHRLAWLYIYGKFPEADIDHINGVPHDNRLLNLRSCTRAQNLSNMKVCTTNSSGQKGVSFDKTRNKWKAQISIKNWNTFIGRFNTKEEASTAYQKFAAELRGSFHSNR